MSQELADYSIPYKADFQFEDLSKDALIRLLKAYRTIFVGLMGMWNTTNRKRMSVEEAFNLDAEVYEKVLRKFYLPLLKEAMHIEGDDVLSLLKIFQVAPDGAGGQFYEFDYDIKDRNHVVLTFTRCPSLSYFEATGTDRDIHCLCGPGGVEDRAFTEFCKLTNADMKCKALQVPPREDKNGICCRWEFKVEP
ncbi:MAG: hypothetical protein U0807_04255 [Candidatus Binatia bacterium]